MSSSEIPAILVGSYNSNLRRSMRCGLTSESRPRSLIEDGARRNCGPSVEHKNSTSSESARRGGSVAVLMLYTTAENFEDPFFLPRFPWPIPQARGNSLFAPAEISPLRWVGSDNQSDFSSNATRPERQPATLLLGATRLSPSLESLL